MLVLSFSTSFSSYLHSSSFHGMLVLSFPTSFSSYLRSSFFHGMLVLSFSTFRRSPAAKPHFVLKVMRAIIVDVQETVITVSQYTINSIKAQLSAAD